MVFASNPNAVLLLDVVVTFARSGARKSDFVATQEVAKTKKRYKQCVTDDAQPGRSSRSRWSATYGHMDELAAGVLRKILRTTLGIVGRVPVESLDTYNKLPARPGVRASAARWLARHTARMAARVASQGPPTAHAPHEGTYLGPVTPSRAPAFYDDNLLLNVACAGRPAPQHRCAAVTVRGTVFALRG